MPVPHATFPLLALCLVAGLHGACGGDTGGSVALPALPDTSLDGSLRRQLIAVENEVRRLAAGGAPAPDIAAAVGGLGRLYHGVQLLEPEAVLMLENALACYREARRLDDADWRWPYLEAFAAETRGRLTEAATGYRDALERGPDRTTPILRLAEVERRLGRFEEAGRLWRRVLATAPSNPFALLGLGRIALDRGDSRAAVDLLERTVELAPAAGEAHHALGLAYRNLGDAESAARHLSLGGATGMSVGDPLIQEMTALPTGSRAFFRRGLLAVQAGALDQAIGLLRSAVEEDSDNLLAYRNLALAEAQAGRREEAAATLAGLAARDPADAWARVELGRLMAEDGRLDQALPHLREAVRLAPDYLAGRIQLGLALMRAGDAAAAIRQLEAATGIDPFSAEARNQYAAALAVSGRAEEGERLLRERLVAAPDDAGAARILSGILRQQGRTEDARQVLERTLEAGEPAPADEGVLRLELGRLLAMEAAPARALSHLEAARRLVPELHEPAFLAGLVAAQLGRLDQASDAFAEVLGSRPGFVPARLGLAEVLARRDRCGEAMDVLQEGRRLQPGDGRLAEAMEQLGGACATDGG